MINKALPLLSLLALVTMLLPGCARQTTTGNSNSVAYSDATQQESDMTTKLATFGGGCFWGVEEVFRNVNGVVDTTVGYCGGNMENPTYKDVCTGKTGHAEVVQVVYNPQEVSYRDLLDVFFANHNPTQLNKQGPDVGEQYRSVIFFHDDEQRQLAEEFKNKLQKSGRYDRDIVTSIEPAQEFYEAEEYHQEYLKKHGLGSCHTGN